MIPLARPPLDDALAERLGKRTEHVIELRADGVKAREIWRTARHERRGIRGHLTAMAVGINQCMYCGDGQGTSIDHFEPITRAPRRTFDWPNHLLACTHCNSNEKRDAYPCDEDGTCLLIDPSREDPREHLRLRLTTGEYGDITPKGKATIETCGLNRKDLVRGRQMAFVVRRSVLRDSLDQLRQGRDGESERVLLALAEQPFADVFHEMVRVARSPHAAEVLGEDVVAALCDSAIINLAWPS